MGIDIEVYFKAEKGSSWDNVKTRLGKTKANDDEDFTEPTHNISSLVRLYDFGYERGHWPEIAEVLMELLADPNISKVWYGGDGGYPEDIKEMTEERFFKITKHYLINMHEPYRSGFM